MTRPAPLAAALAALALAAPSVAAPVNWNRGTAVAISVDNDRFTPARLTLRRGQHYVLRITNRSNRKHNFSAPRFFGMARVAPGDAGWVTDNKVDLAPGQTARLRIVAPTTPNSVYPFRSTNLLDAAEKLKGEIYVR